MELFAVNAHIGSVIIPAVDLAGAKAYAKKYLSTEDVRKATPEEATAYDSPTKRKR